MRALEQCAVTKVKVGDEWVPVHMEQIDEGDEVLLYTKEGQVKHFKVTRMPNMHVELIEDEAVPAESSAPAQE